MRKHSAEEEVAPLLKLKGNERKSGFTALIRKDDFKFNEDAENNPEKRLLVVRENLDDEIKSAGYLPCTSCFGYFKERKLHQHVKICPAASENEKKNPRQLAASRALQASNNHRYSDVHKLILSTMRRDEKYLIIKNDDSLLLLAATNIQAKEKDRYCDIKYSLIILAELLIEFRKLSGKLNSKAKDLVSPDNYDDVLKSAKMITEYNGPRDIGKPNVFRKIGFCLINLAVIVRGLAHKQGCQITLHYITNADPFSNCIKTTGQFIQANVPDALPDEEDVKKLR